MLGRTRVMSVLRPLLAEASQREHAGTIVGTLMLVLLSACTTAAHPSYSEPDAYDGALGQRADRDANQPEEFSEADYEEPLTITTGGTYTGRYASDDPDRAVITVATSEPVVIEDARLRGRGDLIVDTVDDVDLTVRRTAALGLNPDRDGVPVGRFIDVEGPARLVVEENEIVATAGISVLGHGDDAPAGRRISIQRNRVSNIDGRVSNGSGAAGPAGFHDEGQVTLTQFVQLDKVRDASNVTIAWNYVRNDPGASRVEDNISIYLSSGTPSKPIRIHDNLIDGAFPIDPTMDDYAGGGIMLGDGVGDDGTVPAYVVATGNTVLNTSNYGIAVSAGHDITYSDNRVLSSGRLPDGTPIASQNVGVYVWDLNDRPDTFYNNAATGNLVGWMVPDEAKRNDFFFPGSDLADVNESYPGDVTEAVLDAQRLAWLDRARSAGVVIDGLR